MANEQKRPRDLRHTMRVFLSYLGRHKLLLTLVGLLAAVPWPICSAPI